MKAFALANAQGQKLYTITKQNIDKVLPMIQASTLTKGDIRNAVMSGKTVTVHEREVSVPGWHGTGYMVFDPVTGDNAFMISGGGNGGWAKVKEAFDYILDHLDEIAVIFLKHIIGTIVAALDNILDLLTIYKRHGLVQAVIGVLILAMLSQLMTLFILAAMLIASSSTSLVAMEMLITYTFANIFNLLTYK